MSNKHLNRVMLQAEAINILNSNQSGLLKECAFKYLSGFGMNIRYEPYSGVFSRA